MIKSLRQIVKTVINDKKLNVMEEIFVPIGFFLALFAILYVYWSNRTKERLALIEKGIDAGIFKSTPSKYALLKWGIFLMGAAVGVIAGYILSLVINEVVAYFAMIFLFGGVGLITAYLITKKLSQKE
jgi:VIT1/CCC1 family predicted Fe2+/Mn2+ transporter